MRHLRILTFRCVRDEPPSMISILLRSWWDFFSPERKNIIIFLTLIFHLNSNRPWRCQKIVSRTTSSTMLRCFKRCQDYYRVLSSHLPELHTRKKCGEDEISKILIRFSRSKGEDYRGARTSHYRLRISNILRSEIYKKFNWFTATSSRWWCSNSKEDWKFLQNSIMRN